jgi:hypothetical protein
MTILLSDLLAVIPIQNKSQMTRNTSVSRKKINSYLIDLKNNN